MPLCDALESDEIVECHELAEVGATAYASVRAQAEGGLATRLVWTGGSLDVAGPAALVSVSMLDCALPIADLEVRVLSDGEESTWERSLLLLTAGGPREVLAASGVTDSGSGYPAEDATFEMTFAKSARGDAPDVLLVHTATVCADPEDDCTETREERRWCYEPPASWVEKDACVEPAAPPPAEPTKKRKKKKRSPNPE
jgi:hypothetical protein